MVDVGHKQVTSRMALATGRIFMNDECYKAVKSGQVTKGDVLGTGALLSATPRLNPDDRRERIKLTGELPSPLNPPPGCAFNARCRRRFGPCIQLQPQLKDYGGQLVACFAVDQDENPQR